MEEKYRKYIHGDVAIIPDGEKSIERSAFALSVVGIFGFELDEDKEIKKLKEVIIPETVTEIEEHAFSFCIGLKTISLPKSVTIIGPSAFWYCKSLERIVIPENVAEIHDTSFAGCSSVCSIEVSPNNPYFTSKDNCLLTIDGTELILGCKNSIIPQSVKRIRDYAFYGCSELRHIDLPNSITSLGAACFSNCTTLDDIEIPSSIKEIDAWAFENCRNLSHFEIPFSVTSIGKKAFSGCDSLSEIRVSETNPIFTEAQNCLLSKDGSVLIAGFKVSKIPDCVSVIGKSSFEGCRSLVHIDIPTSVQIIEESAFKHSSLQRIELPNSITQIGTSAFDGCDQLTMVQLPTGITVISEACFRNCTSLVDINLPQSINVIEPLAFLGCKNLSRFLIPDGVSLIGYSAFSGCKKISLFEIPASLKSAKTKSGWERCMSDALHGCDSLETVRIKNINPVEVEFLRGAIDSEHRRRITLEVPIGTGYAYRHNPSFTGFKSINAIL